ncbi:MAG: hypothetical protein ACOYNI_06015 [Acidimicrobiia bacterium]
MVPMIGGYEWADALRTAVLHGTANDRAHNDRYSTFLRCLFPRHFVRSFGGGRVRKDVRDALERAHHDAAPSVVDLALTIALAAADELTADELAAFLANIPAVDLGVDLAPADFRALRPDLTLVLRQYEPGPHRASLLQSLVDDELLHIAEHMPVDRVPKAAFEFFADHRDPRLRAYAARHCSDEAILRRAMSPADPLVDRALVQNKLAPSDLLERVVGRVRLVDHALLQTATLHDHATPRLWEIAQARAEGFVANYEGEVARSLRSLPTMIVDAQRRQFERSAPTPSDDPDLSGWWSQRRDEQIERAQQLRSARLDDLSDDDAALLARHTEDPDLLRVFARRVLARGGFRAQTEFGDALFESVVRNLATPDEVVTALATNDRAISAIAEERAEISPPLFRTLTSRVTDSSAAHRLAGHQSCTEHDSRELLARFDDPELAYRLLHRFEFSAAELTPLLDRALAREHFDASEVIAIITAAASTDALRIQFLEHYDAAAPGHLAVAWQIAIDPRAGAEPLTTIIQKTPQPEVPEYQNGTVVTATVRGAAGEHPNTPAEVRRSLIPHSEIDVAEKAAFSVGDDTALLAMFERDRYSLGKLMRKGLVSAHEHPRTTAALIEQPDPVCANEALILIRDLDASLALPAITRSATIQNIDVASAILEHPLTTQAIRNEVFASRTIQDARTFIELARTHADWESLLQHTDAHVALLAATHPNHPRGVGRVRIHTPLSVGETAEAVASGVSVPDPSKHLRWSALPDLDDVPFELAPEIAALDGTTVEYDGQTYNVRIMSDGGTLRENADYMNNCTYSMWRQGIRNGTQAVLAIDDAETGMTQWNVGLDAHGDRWVVREVNSPGNRGASDAVKAAMEVLAPATRTPVHEVREAHRARRAERRQRVVNHNGVGV